MNYLQNLDVCSAHYHYTSFPLSNHVFNSLPAEIEGGQTQEAQVGTSQPIHRTH
jgi:hypothetical protein